MIIHFLTCFKLHNTSFQQTPKITNVIFLNRLRCSIISSAYFGIKGTNRTFLYKNDIYLDLTNIDYKLNIIYSISNR